MAYYIWKRRIYRVTKMARKGDFIQFPRRYLLVVVFRISFLLFVKLSKTSPTESSVVLRPQSLGLFGFTPRFA